MTVLSKYAEVVRASLRAAVFIGRFVGVVALLFVIVAGPLLYATTTYSIEGWWELLVTLGIWGVWVLGGLPILEHVLCTALDLDDGDDLFRLLFGLSAE